MAHFNYCPPSGFLSQVFEGIASAGGVPSNLKMPDAAPASRLNEFAVLAFCAEMTRLPGHCGPRFVPVNATAQTIPSRSTMAPHMFMIRPLPSVLVAAARAAFSCGWLGKFSQLVSSANADSPQEANDIAINAIRLIVCYPLLSVGRTQAARSTPD